MSGITLYFWNLININRTHLDYPICSCILSVDTLFWLKHLKESQPQTDMFLEKGGIFQYLSLQIFFFDTMSNLIHGSSLKSACNMECKTTLINLLYSITLKSTGLSGTSFFGFLFCLVFGLALWMNLLLLKDFVTLCSSLENIGSWSYAGLPNADTFHDAKSITKEITFINITTDLIRKVFKLWETKLSNRYKFSKILIVIWNLEFHQWYQTLSLVFLEAKGFSALFSGKCLLNTQLGMTMVCQLLSSKTGVPWNR